jgi:hypothetical protein
MTNPAGIFAGAIGRGLADGEEARLYQIFL